MANDQGDQTEGQHSSGTRPTNVEQLLRTAAFQAWSQGREDWQDCSIDLFNRAFLGHYSHIDRYVEKMVDDYELDAAIIEPFRKFLDVDVTSLGRALVRHGTLYAISAVPVGVWVFNGEVY